MGVNSFRRTHFHNSLPAPHVHNRWHFFVRAPHCKRKAGGRFSRAGARLPNASLPDFRDLTRF